MQRDVEAKLPVSQGNALSRPISWDAAIQDHPNYIFWRELEDDATFNGGGTSSGTVQNFPLPGLMLDQFKLLHYQPRNRLALLCGVGMQIATVQYHRFNQGLVIIGRLNF